MSELLQAARAASADGPGSQSGMNGSFQSADVISLRMRSCERVKAKWLVRKKSRLICSDLVIVDSEADH